jgi:hypothetical protein
VIHALPGPRTRLDAAVVTSTRGSDYGDLKLVSPQEVSDRNSGEHVWDVRPGGPAPWEPSHPQASERTGPDRVWGHTVYGGLFRLDQLRDARPTRHAENRKRWMEYAHSGRNATRSSPATKPNQLTHGQQHAIREHLPDGSHLAEAGVAQRRQVDVESRR